MGDPFQPLAILSGRHAGATRSGRARYQGPSPFAAAQGGIYSLSHAWLTPATGRGGGEVFPRRSPGFGGFGWPLPPSRPADNNNDEDNSKVPLPPLPTPFAPLRETDPNANAGNANDEARAAAGGAVSAPEKEGARGDEGALAASAVDTKKSSRRRHRRQVTWAGVVETREVERSPKPDVFSPDLHSLAIAQQLAVIVDSPEIQQAVHEVLSARRQAANVARSMSESDGWSGCLDGVVEETWFAWSEWNKRERLYLREMDELVRGVVSPRGDGIGSGVDGAEVYRLKAVYRAARRRMDDVDAD